MRNSSLFGSSDARPPAATSSMVAPEGNFRANEPSPLTDLLSLSQVKVLWIDELAIANASGNANAEWSVWGGGLKARMLYEMKKFQTIPMKLLAEAFPAASAYYREHGCLRMVIEEAPTRFQNIQLSRWENAIASKKFAALVTVLRCPPLPTTSRADGTVSEDGVVGDDALASFSKRLSDVKGLFQDPKFGSSLKRCIVFDPPARLVSSLETDMFVIVKTSTPIAELAKSLMHDIGADLVHLITSRVSALSLSASSNEAVSSFRTPMDKTDFGDGSMDPKSELAKVIRCRAAKRRGDLLLQLEAPDAALMAYGELSISSTDTLWTAAQLEAVASARYLEGRNVHGAGSVVQQVCRAILNCSDLSCLPEGDLTLLSHVESDARDCLTKHRKAMLSLGSALPSLIKQRLAREIEEPQADKVERLCLLIAGIRMCSQRQGSNAAVPNQPVPEWCSAPDAASLQIQELYDQMTSLWFAEVELYLVEAYHQYRMLQPRLFELESELYIKLAWLRAEQRNPRKMLEAIAELNKTLRFVSPEAALRVSRSMPDVCMRCWCRRKAVHSAIEAATREKRAQNYDAALALLLKAAEWSGVPLRCDKSTGALAYVPSVVDASSSAAATASNSAAVTPVAASPSSAARLFVWRDDFRNRGVVKVVSPARSHVSLLFEMMDVLKQAGQVAKPGMRCQLAAAALHLYSDLMDACTQDSVLSVLQLESLMTPSYLQIMVVPPPLLVSMQPLRLPPDLRPRTTSLGGAAFTYIDKERLKMTVLALNGQRLAHDVVWVAGESAVVEVALTNPFDVLLQLTSVALHMEYSPAPGTASSDRPGDALSDVLTPYVLNGLMMKPREDTSIRLYALPRRAGTVHIKGIQILLGQLAFVNPTIVPMDPPIEVPVVPPLPKVEILFSSNDIELFASQRVPITCTVTNISHEEVIDGMTITAHRSACQLVNCNGCRERKHRSFIAANIAAREGFTVDIWQSVVDEALPLHPGESVQVPMHLIAPDLFPSASFDHLFVRVDYHPQYDPPTAVPLGVPAAVPVFAIIPRRVADAKLRIFSTPSLEITNLSLTQDRRFVEVRVRNQCAQRTIELRINGVAPFHDVASSMFLLPAAELILPPVEISKLPANRDACVFQLPWMVRSGVAASYSSAADRHVSYAHEGTLTLDLADVIKDVCSMEPLEEIVVVASFADPPAPNDRSKNALDRSAAASLSSAASLTNTSDNETTDDHALVQQQTWVNVAASRSPIFIPAVENVAVNIIISAPWRTEVSLLVEVLFDLGTDVGMVAGPVKKRVPIGRQDTLGYQETFDIIAFKSGEQFLMVRLTDDQGRCITHHVRLQVEHGRQQ